MNFKMRKTRYRKCPSKCISKIKQVAKPRDSYQKNSNQKECHKKDQKQRDIIININIDIEPSRPKRLCKKQIEVAQKENKTCCVGEVLPMPFVTNAEMDRPKIIAKRKNCKSPKSIKDCEESKPYKPMYKNPSKDVEDDKKNLTKECEINGDKSSKINSEDDDSNLKDVSSDEKSTSSLQTSAPENDNLELLRMLVNESIYASHLREESIKALKSPNEVCECVKYLHTLCKCEDGNSCRECLAKFNNHDNQVDCVNGSDDTTDVSSINSILAALNDNDKSKKLKEDIKNDDLSNVPLNENKDIVQNVTKCKNDIVKTKNPASKNITNISKDRKLNKKKNQKCSDKTKSISKKEMKCQNEEEVDLDNKIKEETDFLSEIYEDRPLPQLKNEVEKVKTLSFVQTLEQNLKDFNVSDEEDDSIHSLRKDFIEKVVDNGFLDNKIVVFNEGSKDVSDNVKPCENKPEKDNSCSSEKIPRDEDQICNELMEQEGNFENPPQPKMDLESGEITEEENSLDKIVEIAEDNKKTCNMRRDISILNSLENKKNDTKITVFNNKTDKSSISSVSNKLPEFADDNNPKSKNNVKKNGDENKKSTDNSSNVKLYKIPNNDSPHLKKSMFYENNEDLYCNDLVNKGKFQQITDPLIENSDESNQNDETSKQINSWKVFNSIDSDFSNKKYLKNIKTRENNTKSNSLLKSPVDFVNKDIKTKGNEQTVSKKDKYSYKNAKCNSEKLMKDLALMSSHLSDIEMILYQNQFKFPNNSSTARLNKNEDCVSKCTPNIYISNCDYKSLDCSNQRRCGTKYNFKDSKNYCNHTLSCNDVYSLLAHNGLNKFVGHESLSNAIDLHECHANKFYGQFQNNLEQNQLDFEESNLKELKLLNNWNGIQNDLKDHLTFFSNENSFSEEVKDYSSTYQNLGTHKLNEIPNSNHRDNELEDKSDSSVNFVLSSSIDIEMVDSISEDIGNDGTFNELDSDIMSNELLIGEEEKTLKRKHRSESQDINKNNKFQGLRDKNIVGIPKTKKG